MKHTEKHLSNLIVENVSDNLIVYVETNLYNIVRLSAKNSADNYSTEKEYQNYYYNYDTVDNNVKFANFCWKGVKTTEAGGVRLIYNGVPAEDGSCNNTDDASSIGKSTFFTSEGLNSYNLDYFYSLTSIGYMYGDAYPSKSSTLSSRYQVIHDTYPGEYLYYYSSSYSYENGSYILDNPEQRQNAAS